MIKVVAIIGAGLVNFFVIGNLVDLALHNLGLKVAKPSGDELVDALQLQPSRERHIILNIVRPVASTAIIFGGGAIVIGWLRLTFWGAVGSFAYFFFLTQMACLVGRKHSLNVAGWAMVVTMACVIVLYNVLK